MIGISISSKTENLRKENEEKSQFRFRQSSQQMMRHPTMPDQMPYELLQELETMKQSENNVANMNSNMNKKPKGNGILAGSYSPKKSTHKYKNVYREVHSPIG